MDIDIKNIDNDNKKLRIEELLYTNKRVTREYHELSKIYSDIDIFYNFKKDLITFIIYVKNNEYKFIMNCDYPFIPPDIYYNNKTYAFFLKMASNRFVNMLMNLTNKSCLCCESFSCRDKWSPCIMLNDVITEINKNRRYKKCIVINILINQIKDKYLINDIDIRSYIF